MIFHITVEDMHSWNMEREATLALLSAIRGSINELLQEADPDGHRYEVQVY